jgi:hypothetical protein
MKLHVTRRHLAFYGHATAQFCADCALAIFTSPFMDTSRRYKVQYWKYPGLIVLFQCTFMISPSNLAGPTRDQTRDSADSLVLCGRHCVTIYGWVLPRWSRAGKCIYAHDAPRAVYLERKFMSAFHQLGEQLVLYFLLRYCTHPRTIVDRAIIAYDQDYRLESGGRARSVHGQI